MLSQAFMWLSWSSFRPPLKISWSSLGHPYLTILHYNNNIGVFVLYFIKIIYLCSRLSLERMSTLSFEQRKENSIREMTKCRLWVQQKLCNWWLTWRSFLSAARRVHFISVEIVMFATLRTAAFSCLVHYGPETLHICSKTYFRKLLNHKRKVNLR